MRQWIPGVEIARELFPHHWVKESKAATLMAGRLALDVFTKEQGAARGRHVFSITDQSTMDSLRRYA